jgi:murein DD-endopeptidase MepM/ murein hydrolase activator NlpD
LVFVGPGSSTRRALQESQTFGAAYGGPNKSVPRHDGIDVPCQEGQQVLALLNGKVCAVWKDEHGALVITIDSGFYTVSYGHFKTVTLHGGEFVIAGDVIGECGSSGNARGPHVHLMVQHSSAVEACSIDIELEPRINPEDVFRCSPVRD